MGTHEPWENTMSIFLQRLLLITVVSCAASACEQELLPESLNEPLGSWTATGSMTTPREDQTATPLPSGKVLVVGGGFLDSAELYDPDTGTWSRTGSMSALRGDHTATVLPSGKVLIAGGSHLG